MVGLSMKDPVREQQMFASRAVILFMVIIFMLGLQTNRTTFGYSYDYTISDLGIGTGGAHEISISYSFSLGDPLKPAADVRRLKCPIPFIF